MEVQSVNPPKYIRSLTKRERASRILLRPDGEELPVTEHEGRTSFFLPCLRVHALVEIETA